MKQKYENGKLMLQNLPDFEPIHIFDCGQAFRWEFANDRFIGIVGNKVIAIEKEDDDIILSPCTKDEYQNIWHLYFDLNTDYQEIKKQLSVDPIMKDAIDYGYGIRILNQEPWETLISFIISSNNGISRIKKIINNISSRFGEAIEFEGRIYYTFPSIRRLANTTEEELLACGTGYRASYVLNTARRIYDGFPLHEIGCLQYGKAKEMLMSLPGVGPKVADCILLFSLGFREAFPIDVWIQRTIENLYFHNQQSPKKLHHFVHSHFGSLAGYAQQYLFYYGWKKKIGK